MHKNIELKYWSRKYFVKLQFLINSDSKIKFMINYTLYYSYFLINHSIIYRVSPKSGQIKQFLQMFLMKS